MFTLVVHMNIVTWPHGGHGQGGGAILMTHVQKCVTDLIRCSGGAGSPEHRLPWSDSGVNSLSHV